MGTDISGITKTILQMKSNLKAEAQGGKPEQKASVSFMEFMNQGAQKPNISLTANSGEAVYRVEPTDSGKTQAAYDNYANSAQGTVMKEGAIAEEIPSEAAGLFGGYEEEVTEILKEELGVTEEDIARAMEELGISFADLSNLKDLAALVQELTGEDIGTLFLSEAFQNVKDQVMEAVDTLCDELGITKEEWSLIAEAIEQQTRPAEDVSQDMPKNLEAVSAEDVLTEEQTVLTHDDVATVEGGTVKTDTAREQNTATVVVQKEEAPQEEEIPVQTSKEESRRTEALGQNHADARSTGGETQENTSFGSDTEATGQENAGQAMGNTPEAANINALFTDGQPIQTEETILPQQETVPYASQLDTMDLIEQIARNVRVTVTAETTSMEMQLNPENLGKIYLNISEKEGAVRAQIAAQNQVVKEALETQVAELRQSLNQQGIKVDAIEVTVASHEFEQNLEENARQEEQMRQQMEESGKQTRRSLNLNDLDELTGLMTEEEQLAAQIMRDNGNQVDLTA